MTPEAFETLVQPFRRELAAHCYRMLGSVQDAEDQVQETLLSAWRGIDGFEGRASVRGWLYKIATNRCLDEIRRRPRHGLPPDRGEPGDPLAPIPPPGELLWVEPAPPGMWEGAPSAEATYSQRESVQLAFIVALQHLPATQRAALILREVVGWSATEVASLLDTTVASVNSALQRARSTLDARRPQLELPAAESDAIALRYVAAWEAGDVDALVALLRDDVTISMPPMPSWFRGREAVTSFFRARMATPTTRRVLRIAAADELVFALYRGTEFPLEGYAIHVMQLAPDGVAEIHAFIDRTLFPRFGVPTQIER
jgi:RNA polymerase sigma-70 factor, ECF subfamily